MAAKKISKYQKLMSVCLKKIGLKGKTKAKRIALFKQCARESSKKSKK